MKNSIFWERPDALLNYFPSISGAEEIARLRSVKSRHLELSEWEAVRLLLSELQPPDGEQRYHIDVSSAVVSVGDESQLTAAEHSILREVVASLIPWRKGPFRLFGLEIDAEWRSDRKWDRVRPYLPNLRGKRIADIGSNTGYYMFRMLADEPSLVVGFEPSARCFYSFELVQRFVQDARLQTELLGVEDIVHFADFFDVVFCMGILYHHRNPLALLEGIRAALRQGGEIIVESQAIPGSGPMALFPLERYGKARNVYFVPTESCLVSWVKRAGFKDVELISSVVLNVDEQRRTEFSPGESLSDFLDARDPTRTIEGYPAPLRIAVRGRKG